MCVKQLSQLMPAKIKNAVGYKLWTNVMLTSRMCETQISTPSAEVLFQRTHVATACSWLHCKLHDN